ncbi:MAG: sulfite exporter TauE/SafE family protein [Actinobacteria bacterium]|nr:MAG: sulfite exporter TauE/SafE family protein [Actinomycetota bacterium]
MAQSSMNSAPAVTGSTWWKLVFVGVAAGVLGGGLGLGGGIIMVPLLMYVGFDRHAAHATSLAAIVLIALSGSLSFGLSGELDLAVGLTIGVGGVVGSVIGATFMNRMSARSLTVVFAFVLIVAGARMVLGGNPEPGSIDLVFILETVIALGIGMVAGLFAGLAGIGGGVVNVPASVFFLGLAQHEAQGTSLLAILLTAIAGTITNYRNGRVRLRDGMFVGLGGATGSLIGSQVALGTSEDLLAVIFGSLVLFVGARTLYRVWRGPAQTA